MKNLWVLGLSLGVSLLTFCVYGVDKARARRGGSRVRESTLHLLSLAGGWPGGFLAQRVFHHKSRKTPFLVVFWLTALVNGAVVGWLILGR